jgi:parvulin-like peptidyl-prolyl isomerase
MTTAFAAIKSARLLLAIAAGFVALAFAMWGVERGLAAAVGATLSVLNWFALRWLTGRIAQSDGQSKGSASLLLVAKMGLLMALVYILIQRLNVDPIGLAFGLGVLFIGPVVTALVGTGVTNAAGADPAALKAGAQPAGRQEH